LFKQLAADREMQKSKLFSERAEMFVTDAICALKRMEAEDI
jgi:hypothetical protein